jgi:hypothetical protein
MRVLEKQLVSVGYSPTTAVVSGNFAVESLYSRGVFFQVTG